MSWEHEGDIDVYWSTGSVLQFLIAPSFEQPFRWDVLRVVSPDGERQTKLYRRALGLDLKARNSDSPIDSAWRPSVRDSALQADWVLLDSEKLAAILLQFRQVRFPLIPAKSRIGCDGTSYELAFGDAFGNVRIAWWEDLPEGWQELAPVVDGLKDLFESTWKEQRG